MKMEELHEAYVGVVEVLSQYLQSAHPRLKAQSGRVAELSQAMAVALRLSPKEIDDIRVASLLYHVGSIEITTKVIRRAGETRERAVSTVQVEYIGCRGTPHPSGGECYASQS